MERKVFENNIFKVWMRDDGILQEDFFDEAEIGIDDVKKVVKIASTYFKQKNLTYVDVSNIKSISYEARKYLQSEEASENVKAVAFKVKSKVSIFMAKFLNTVNRPKYPTKPFTDEKKAIEWLKSFK